MDTLNKTREEVYQTLARHPPNVSRQAEGLASETSHCTFLTQALKNCEETNSKGSDRTGISRLKEKR